MSISTPPDVSMQLAEIQGIFGCWKAISTWLSPILMFLPLSALWFDFLSCPQYEKYQPVIATLSSIFVVAFMFYVFRKLDERTIYRWAIGFFVAGVASAVVYIVLLFCLVAHVDEDRYLMGFSLSSRAAKAIENNEIKSRSPKALLAYFGFESEDDIWSARWLAGASLFILSAAIFSMLSSAFFLFTLRSVIQNKAIAASPATSAPPLTGT